MNHWENVKELFKDPTIDINEGDWTIFHWACWNENYEIVDLLLQDFRVNIQKPDKNGITGSLIARQFGFVKIIKRILASGREVDLRILNTSKKYQKNHEEITNLLIFYQSQSEKIKFQLREELDLPSIF